MKFVFGKPSEKTGLMYVKMMAEEPEIERYNSALLEILPMLGKMSEYGVKYAYKDDKRMMFRYRLLQELGMFRVFDYRRTSTNPFIFIRRIQTLYRVQNVSNQDFRIFRIVKPFMLKPLERVIDNRIYIYAGEVEDFKTSIQEFFLNWRLSIRFMQDIINDNVVDELMRMDSRLISVLNSPIYGRYDLIGASFLRFLSDGYVLSNQYNAKNTVKLNIKKDLPKGLIRI